MAKTPHVTGVKFSVNKIGVLKFTKILFNILNICIQYSGIILSK